MKHVLLIAAAALVFAAPASAQAASSSQIIERMRQADTNNDGAVSRPEFINYRAEQFGRFDRNGDGYITQNDMPRLFARRAPNGASPAEMITQFDANGDGRVSQAEFVNGPTLVFDQVDANDDNVCTEAELNAAIAAARAAG